MIARLLWGENAQNLTEDEALGIGDAVLNRTQLPQYPKTIYSVLNQPNQFSPYNRKDPNYKRIRSFDETHPKWQEYASLAVKILDPARQRSAVTHYFSQSPPAWASSMIGLEKRGSHWFGQEDPASRRRPLKEAVADVYMGRRR